MIDIKSPWGGEKRRAVAHELPGNFGVGMKVMVSFYAAPECCILVEVDESLPLDLPLPARCHGSDEVRSFRDLLPVIYDRCREFFGSPPELSEFRKADFVIEGFGEDLWAGVIDGGSSWSWWEGGSDD